MSNGPFRVLFVDDDQLVLSALQRTLRGEDYEVLTTNEPLHALRLMDELQIDVIVSDQAMPEMSGVELLGVVEQKYAHTVRVILTGHGTHGADATDIASVQRQLEKPWQSEQLRHAIRELVEEARRRRGG
ncbi:MAG TPA: response regulator [Myxococcota bacterium]